MQSVDIKMADISNKKVTSRSAVAEASISLKKQTIKLIMDKKIPKGDVLAVAKCAGILAAKKTDQLIPLCHPLPLEHAQISFRLKRDSILITVKCKTRAKTGVEMEAMFAASVAVLTVYDMCKPIDRGAIINRIRLIEKIGGKSGHYKRK